MTAREIRGQAIFATSKREVAQAESIESLSILRGLQLSTHQGFINIIIESDCLLVVNEICNVGPLNSIFENIIYGIKELMSHFCNYRVQYVNRQVNITAHKLARNA